MYVSIGEAENICQGFYDFIHSLRLKLQLNLHCLCGCLSEMGKCRKEYKPFFKEVARGGEQTRVLLISFIFSFSALYR
jgi:hypothetical protein